MQDKPIEQAGEDLAFRKLCSDLTLQTKKDGFFKDYLATIADEVTKEQYDEFATKTTDRDRILYCWTLPALHKVVPAFRPIYKAKSAEESVQRRESGNEAFKAKDYGKALNLYNQSVIHAPYSSLLEKTTLATALANRSAALVHLKQYDLAVRDIHLALQSNYPEKQRYKLYDRLAYCHQQQGESAKASVNWTIARDCLNESDLSAESKQQWTANIEKSIKSIENNKKPVQQRIRDGEPTEREPSLFNGPHSDFPTASKALKLVSSEQSGRYFVANQDIKPAQTLVAELPYAACLLPDKFGTHCHHCFVRLVAPLGCMTCRGVGYCSTACRDEAASTYHQYECGIIDILTASGVSILSWIALRILTQGKLQDFLAMRNRLEQLQDNPRELPRVETADYERVYQLATLSHLRKDKDFFDRTFMAIFLFQCLRASGYLPMAQDRHVQDAQSITEEEVFIATLILRHLQFLQFNAHEIHEFVQGKDNSMRTTKTIYIGVGIYPTVAYFNHSCRTDVTRYFVGKKLVITSSRTVKRGQVVSENYGPMFTHKEKLYRQTNLQGRYWFSCTCTACENNWPSYDAMPDMHAVLSCCPFCRGGVKSINSNYVKCVACKRQSTLVAVQRPVNELNALYQAGLKLMDEKQVDKAVELLSAFIDTVETLLPDDRPVRELCLAQEALRLCLGTYGTTYSAEHTLSLKMVQQAKNKSTQ